MGKEKIGIKYTVRSATAGLYALLLVVGFQNCAIYQNSDGGVNETEITSESPEDETPTNTNNNGNNSSNSKCVIVGLTNGGTKISKTHTFQWIVAEADCIVEAQINSGRWNDCTNSVRPCTASYNFSYNLITNNYGTKTLNVRTFTTPGAILDEKQVTVTLNRPLGCNSYQECEQSRQNRSQTNCTCNSSNNNGHTCYNLSCSGNPEDDEELIQW